MLLIWQVTQVSSDVDECLFSYFLCQLIFFFDMKALTHLEGVTNPLPQSESKFYVLIETTGSDEANDRLAT